MIDLVFALLVGAGCGAVLGYLAGQARGTATERQRHQPVPADAPGAPLQSEYEIRRNGVSLWIGSDPHLAKTWWEHAKVQPGHRSLLFLENGTPRDHFSASA